MPRLEGPLFVALLLAACTGAACAPAEQANTASSPAMTDPGPVTSTPTARAPFRPISEPAPSVLGACTMDLAYWKTHPGSWRHRELQMGQITYSKEEQLSILEQPGSDNGLVDLAHQVIAARLNIAAGASAEGLQNVLAEADVLIGLEVLPPRGAGWRAPDDTRPARDTLAAFNEGRVGPGHCQF
jgi:hypothetical protein